VISSVAAAAAQVVVACLLVGLLLAASHAEASAEPQAAAALTHRKLAAALQSKPEWKSSKCVSFGDAKLKEGGKELHPHDYCAKTGGTAVCCLDDKCGGSVTCRGGNRQACCPTKR
jgi:hypothetical protein